MSVSQPFVAIIGGFWKIKDDAAKFAEAKETASQIGAALAKAGMGLVVYFSNDESLEPHVVSGYVKELPLGAGEDLIRVRFAESQKGQVRFTEQNARPELFRVRNFPGQEWEAPFYRSLVAADGVDAVLLMAGDRSTLIAGQIALARPLPILAVDKFDGAAGTVRTELAIKGEYPSSATHTLQQSVAWLKEQLAERARKQEQFRLQQEQEQEQIRLQQEQARHWESKYLNVTSQKGRTLWAAGAFVALLAAVFFGVLQKPSVGFYPFLTFLGLIAAGATGALVRSVMSKAEETAPTTSLVLGAIAGFVVGVAYLVPQFVGAPGPLDPKAAEIMANDKIQFVSSVLVAVSAGVGFDTVFTRLKKQAEDQPIGPPGKKSA